MLWLDGTRPVSYTHLDVYKRQGVNNSVDNFMAAIEKHKPDILGMSALLTTTMPYMRVVIDAMHLSLIHI